ncbi:MAG TPA: methyltransferase, partial [Roseiflexaceae bacterium]
MRTMTSIKILPPTYLLLAIIAMVLLHFVWPVATVIAVPWNLIGVVPLAVGILMNVIADNVFHRAKTTVRPFEESTVLVTRGVYRLSRNPMYLGFVLMLIGVA